MVKTEYDVIIVGGGMVGGSMACALTGADLKVAVIEASPVEADTQPSFDERTIALTYSSRQIFSGLGCGSASTRRVKRRRFSNIEVSDRGHLGFCRLSHEDAGTEALGYVVPTRVTGRVLHDAIRADESITLFCPAQVVDVSPNAESRRRARIVMDGLRKSRCCRRACSCWPMGDVRVCVIGSVSNARPKPTRSRR